MNQHFLDIVLKTTGAKAISSQEVIQTLWSGYGEIVKLGLAGTDRQSVVLKYIMLPQEDEQTHTRGWNTQRSRERKIKSYQVETCWYHDWSNHCSEWCRAAECYASIADGHEQVIILEDLDAAGFPLRKSHLKLHEVKTCLSWLANFHATFMQEKPTGLWEVGTYWHLETRPDELAAMQNKELQRAAGKIDKLLNDCKYHTFVHGDAKVANFCFSRNGKQAAAVDFQYVGGGCGMKDVAYFLGSCLTEQECEQWESELLDYYFTELNIALDRLHSAIDFNALQAEWRPLFAVAWTDFYRFLLGWMPTHQKINNYTQMLASKVLATYKQYDFT